MDWDVAETSIRTHIEAQWALGAHASVKIFFENEDWIEGTKEFMYVDIQGLTAEKTIFGSVGKRMAVDSGIVYFHAFVEKGIGKTLANRRIVAMSRILELQTIASVIDLEGSNPPSPIEDDELILGRSGGNYFRCSGSVPFIVRSSI